MEELRRGFRLQRSNSSLWRTVGRSKSSRLVLEAVPADCAAVAGYQRLSQSMRFADEPAPMRKQQRGNRTWRFLARAFSRKHVEDDNTDATKEAHEKETKGREKNKKRSSWLPDPARRWPVQGW